MLGLGFLSDIIQVLTLQRHHCGVKEHRQGQNYVHLEYLINLLISSDTLLMEFLYRTD